MQNKGHNYSIESKIMFINILTPVEVGQVKATILSQVIVTADEDGTLDHDFDQVNVENVTYMGAAVDNSYKGFSAFCDFHKTMGIDISKLLNDEVEKVLTKEVRSQIIKDNCSGLLEVKQATVKSTTDKPTWDEVRKALEHKFGKHSVSGTYYNDKRKTGRRIKMGDYDRKKLAWLNKQFPQLKAYVVDGFYIGIKFDL